MKELNSTKRSTSGSDALISAHCPVNGPPRQTIAAAEASEVRRISSLSDHRAFLRHVFQTAKERVIVVSPFISKSALNSDHVPDMIRNAKGRGVSVSVYTDSGLNRTGTGEVKQSAAQGVNELINAGAQVHVVSGIHNKTLIRDNDLIAEGSFNWLSAVRTKGASHQREERTMVIEGKQATGMIEEELANIEKTSDVPKEPNQEYEKDEFSKTTIFAVVIFAIIIVAVMLALPEETIKKYLFQGTIGTIGIAGIVLYFLNIKAKNVQNIDSYDAAWPFSLGENSPSIYRGTNISSNVLDNINE